MPGVLLVSHNFPPTAGPESSLVKLNAEFLHRQGWDLRVLTTTEVHATQSIDPTLLNGLPPSIRIERVGSPEAVLAQKLPRVGRTLAVWAGRYVLPEVYMPWMFPATARGMKMLSEWSPDLLYSRATKHVSNVVGWRLKRRTGLPWVAHFSDPWISGGMPKRPLQRWLGEWWERRILRDADAVVCVTQQAAKGMLAAAPEAWRKRMHVIPHGFQNLPHGVRLSADSDHRRPLKLIHAGAFYPTMRSPDVLVEALRRMVAKESLQGRLQITCIGVDTTCFQPMIDAAGVGTVMTLQGGVPFDECQRRIAASDVILIIDTPGYGGAFLPTKLIEGFAFQKPMLGLAEPDSAVADTLRLVGQHWAALDDPDAVAAKLKELLNAWESGTLAMSPAQILQLQQFHIDTVNQPLLEIFRRLAKR